MHVGEANPVVGMITCHPHPDRRPLDHDPEKPCKHLILSPAFHVRFGKITEIELFEALIQYCGSQRGGMLGQSEMILSDDNNKSHRFYFETFFNKYDALTLGVYLQQEPVHIFSQIKKISAKTPHIPFLSFPSKSYIVMMWIVRKISLPLPRHRKVLNKSIRS